MATNVTLSVSEPVVNVSTTTDTVNVSTTTSNVIVSNLNVTTNAIIRASISNTDPVLYNTTTGVISVNNTTLLSGQTTDNLTEGSSNLYLTNARVRAALTNVSPILYNSSNGEISIDGTALFSGKTTDDLAEGNTNFYFTNARFNTNFNSKSTDDLNEGSTNLYFTNGRARSAISGADQILNYDNTTGVFSEANDEGHLTNGTQFNNPLTAVDSVYLIKTSGTALQGIGGAGAELGFVNFGGSSNVAYANSRLEIPSALNVGGITSSSSNISTTATVIAGALESNAVTPPGGTFTVSGEGSITGNLVVGGNIDYTHVNDLYVANTEIVLNANSVVNLDSQLTIHRPQSANNAYIRWNEAGTEAGSKWEFYWNGNAYTLPRTTDDLAEGTTNLYLNGSGTTSDLAEGTNLYYTQARMENRTDDISFVSASSGGKLIFNSTQDANSAQSNIATSIGNSGGTNIFTVNLGKGESSLLANGSTSKMDYISVLGRDETQIGFQFQNNASLVDSHLINHVENVYSNNNNASARTHHVSFNRELYDGSDTLTSGNWALEVNKSNTSGDAGFIKYAYDTGTWFFGNTGASSTGTKIPVTTTDLTEGSNLYYTTARANSAINDYQGDINTTGNITAAYFSGDGSGLTGVTSDVETESVIRTVIADEDVAVGDAVAITGGTGDNPNVSKALASNTSLMPAFGIMLEAVTATNSGNCLLYGEHTSIDMGTFPVGDEIFVSASTAGALSNVAPTGEANLLQKIGKVVKTGTGGKLTVQGAGRTNATPNLDDGAIFAGSSTNQAVAVDTTTNFSVSDTTFDLSNSLSNVNTIIAEENANSVISTSGITKYQVRDGLDNYYGPGILGASEGIRFSTDLPASITDGTQVNLTGFSGSGANLNGSYYIQSYGGFQAYLLWEDANLSVASNSNIGGTQTLSPAGFLDTGTSFGNITTNSSESSISVPLDVTGTGTFSEVLTVGGDGSGVGEINTKEYADGTGGAGFNFDRGRGTEASPTELKQGDFIMSFQSKGIQNRYDAPLKQLRLSTIQSIQVDNPNTFKTVPSSYAFGGQRATTKVFDTSTYSLTNDFQNYGFRLGGTEEDSSKTYLQNSVVATPDKAFAPKGLVVGNETALQEGLTEANLSIGHTDVEVTIPVGFNKSYQANSGIQYYSFGAQFYNFLTRGTGNLNGDQVCIELFSNLKPEADYQFAGYQEGWIADGSKITLPDTSVTVNGPTGALANIGNSTITGASNNEFYVKGVSNFGAGRIYAFFTDSAMSNALTWSALGGGTPGVDGTDLGGWGNVTYKTGDYSMLMTSSNVTTSGSGTDADFIVSKSGSTYTVGSNFDISPATQRGDVFGYNMLKGGSGFAVSDTVTISGEYLGGVSGTNNLTFTVDSVDGSGAITSIGNVAGTGYDVTNEMWSIRKGVTTSELEITNNNTSTSTRRMNLGSNVVLNLASHSNTEILAFTGNTAGDVVYNSTDNRVAYYNGSTWQNLDAGTTIT